MQGKERCPRDHSVWRNEVVAIEVGARHVQLMLQEMGMHSWGGRWAKPSNFTDEATESTYSSRAGRSPEVCLRLRIQTGRSPQAHSFVEVKDQQIPALDHPDGRGPRQMEEDAKIQERWRHHVWG